MGSLSTVDYIKLRAAPGPGRISHLGRRPRAPRACRGLAARGGRAERRARAQTAEPHIICAERLVRHKTQERGGRRPASSDARPVPYATNTTRTNTTRIPLVTPIAFHMHATQTSPHSPAP